jgi:hypothetical protein
MVAAGVVLLVNEAIVPQSELIKVWDVPAFCDM